MGKKVFIIEFQGSKRQGEDGHLPDTKHILKAFEEVLDIEGETLFYEKDKEDEIEKYLKDNASCVISRIDVFSLKDLDGYFAFLRRLYEYGIEVHTHPDTMLNLDFKDVLVRLKDTPLGEKSAYFYKDFEDFTQKFPPILRDEKVRVLKKNYGLSGEDIYLVKFDNDQTVKCKEAKGNKEINFASIYEFLKFFEPKFKDNCENKIYANEKAGFVDCKYLPRIEEGEIRVFLVRDRAVGVVRKIPENSQFSATITSGATYHFEAPTLEKWRDIVEFTLDGLDYIEGLCKNEEFPLLWTMDYILDSDTKGNDKYILSEINCSCVDISGEIKYAKEMADSFE